MADDRMSYSAPFMQWPSIYLVAAFALALALGVTGDLGGVRLDTLARFGDTTPYRGLLCCDPARRHRLRPQVRSGSRGSGRHWSPLGWHNRVWPSHLRTRRSASLSSWSAFLLGFWSRVPKRGKGGESPRRTRPKPPGRITSREPKTADAGRGGKIPVGFVRAVRAPLSAIESAGYVLEESTLTDENHHEVAGIILRECHRLDVLLRSLEIVQTWSPSYEQVTLSSMLDEIIRRGDPLTQAAHITLRKEKGSDLMIVCDSELVEQAALNLLANATRIVERGEGSFAIRYRVKNTAIIEISDQRLGVLAQLGITLAAAFRKRASCLRREH